MKPSGAAFANRRMTASIMLVASATTATGIYIYNQQQQQRKEQEEEEARRRRREMGWGNEPTDGLTGASAIGYSTWNDE